MLVSAVTNRGEVTLAAAAAPERPPRPTSVWKRKRRTPDPSRTLRRGVLQEDSVEEEEASDEDANDDGSTDPYEISGCAIDTDPNLMPRGADQCTGLNSDDDPDLREEPEKEEEDGNTDSWDGDWDIGALTDDESDGEFASFQPRCGHRPPKTRS
ncbi:Pleiotropic drug resistance protein transporter [Phytophthora megakarya]|uniref:Pleiotropic drug resistance protein transporter n=1 Tax=Phytophthora megakarya TaxID=4795 RepID=A0A225VA39_9STRA|nr:Pleiotropic drug resistance protein transporter [Phytophthora megakarya]